MLIRLISESSSEYPGIILDILGLRTQKLESSKSGKSMFVSKEDRDIRKLFNNAYKPG